MDFCWSAAAEAEWIINACLEPAILSVVLYAGYRDILSPPLPAQHPNTVHGPLF